MRTPGDVTVRSHKYGARPLNAIGPPPLLQMLLKSVIANDDAFQVDAQIRQDTLAGSQPRSTVSTHQQCEAIAKQIDG
jgi:hypothetical protein